MRPFLLISIFVLLCLMDAGTTVYLNENYPSGRELNPYTDPRGWLGILLAPVKFIVYAVFLLGVVIAERRIETISSKEGLLSDSALLAYLPLFLIFTKLFAITNNLMPTIGISTPISFVLMFMKNFPGNESLHYSIFWSVLFLVLAPLGLTIVKSIYRFKPTA